MEWQAAYLEYRRQRVPPELTAVGTASPRVHASPWLSAAPSSPRNPSIKVCGSWRVLLDERDREPPQACVSTTSVASSTLASPYCVGGRASPKPRAFSARMEAQTLGRHPAERAAGRRSSPAMRNEYPWIPGGNETFSAVAPPRPLITDPAFPSTGAPASDTLTCGHGAQTRPITASELAACWPSSLRRRSMHAAASTATTSPRRGGEDLRIVIEPEVILSPSTEDVEASRGQGGELSAWTPEPSTSRGFSTHENDSLASDSLTSMPSHGDMLARANAQRPPLSPSTDHSDDKEGDMEVQRLTRASVGSGRRGGPAADGCSPTGKRQQRGATSADDRRLDDDEDDEADGMRAVLWASPRLEEAMYQATGVRPQSAAALRARLPLRRIHPALRLLARAGWPPQSSLPPSPDSSSRAAAAAAAAAATVPSRPSRADFERSTWHPLQSSSAHVETVVRRRVMTPPPSSFQQARKHAGCRYRPASTRIAAVTTRLEPSTQRADSPRSHCPSEVGAEHAHDGGWSAEAAVGVAPPRRPRPATGRKVMPWRAGARAL